MSRELEASAGRVWAMLLRYLYLLRSSWPRTLELLYWPTLQMLIWGFMSQFLYSNSSYVFRAFGVLLAAVMLWDVLFRGQLGLSMSFLEEMWARNLGHLFVTPLRPSEWVLSLLSMSMIRVLLGILPAALLAIPLYHYSIFAMGLPLVAFFAALLIMGWALGLAICGLILRQGMGAEGLAWTVVFTLSPISCVYYPVSILPGLAATCRLGAAIDLCLRGHADGPVHRLLPQRLFLHGDGPRPRVCGAGRGGLFCRLSQCAPPRCAVANG